MLRRSGRRTSATGAAASFDGSATTSISLVSLALTDTCPAPSGYPDKTAAPNLTDWRFAGPRATTTDVAIVQWQYRAACYVVSSIAGKSDGHWTAGSYSPQGKRPGLEGPISAVVSTGHIYVYGTADNPPESELKSRRDVAEEAASWSSDRARTSL